MRRLHEVRTREVPPEVPSAPGVDVVIAVALLAVGAVGAAVVIVGGLYGFFLLWTR